MPAPVTYSNIAALLDRIQQRMTVNGAQENTGARTQQLLQEIALSLIAIIGDAPDAVGSIQPWDAGLEYTDQVIVSHNGSLWLYAGGAPNTGTQPGTDNTVWLSLGAPPTPSLAQVLTVGQRTGAHDLDVDAGQAIAFRGPESDGRIRLVPTAVTDDGEIKLPSANGTLALTSQLPDMSAIDLHAVLVNGTETNGRSITVSEGDGINYKAATKQVRVKAPATLADDRNVQWPDKSGTVATTDDVAAVAALVDGTLKAPAGYTPSGGLYPATYYGAAVKKGDTFRLGAGTMGTRTVDAEDLLIALVDAPGQTDANWQVIESNRVVATQAEAEDSTSTDLAKLVPPQRWWQAWSKGLTLAAFGSAVRGMLLTGYAVGANAAVAATDSIMAAIAKLQGQVNATNTAVGGKLAKASNLGDLTSLDAARANLELGAMALENTTYSTEVRLWSGSNHLIEDSAPWVSEHRGYLALDYEPGVLPGSGGKWMLAHTGRNNGRVLGIGVGVFSTSPTSITVARIYTTGQFYAPVIGVQSDLTGGMRKATWCLTNKPGLLLPMGHTGPSPGGPGTIIDASKQVMISEPGSVMPGWDMFCQILGPAGGATGASSGGGGQMVQLTDGWVTNLGTAAGGQTIFDSLLSTVKVDPGIYQVELKLGLKVKDTVNSPAWPGFASVALEVTPNTVANKAYGTLTSIQKPAGAPGLSGVANEGYDKSTLTWTALNDAGDGVVQTTVLRGIVAIPSNATGGVEATRYWRVRIASSDAEHTVTNVGTSYIVWTKIKGV
ncbi:MAG: hypothetical protein JST38_00120 [Bacteroidetes bacterium]|nr:hypothetical protein [Bacteroidota bacterium]